MLNLIKSYHNAITNKGIGYVSTEFDRRSLRLLNFICFYGAILILPAVLVKHIIETNYPIVFLLFITIILNATVIYLNSIGKSQISCLLFSFGLCTLGYAAIYLEANQVEVPFLVLIIGFVSIFLIKDSLWRFISFAYCFVTFSILFYIQLHQEVFNLSSFFLTLIALLLFALSLQFVNRLRNKNEKIILKQNEALKNQNKVIKEKSEQLLQLEKEKHKQELLLKEKDVEMILTNNQVQTQLNENIINKLKLAQQEGELEKNINQVILELRQQNEINGRMKLMEENIDLVNAGFLDSLTKAHPNMTRVDKEFCSYIKIGLSSKEIAIIRNTSVNSVTVTKSRLRKKLNLLSNKDIAPYLASL